MRCISPTAASRCHKLFPSQGAVHIQLCYAQLVHPKPEIAGVLTWLASRHARRHRVDQEGVWVVVLY